MIKFFTEHIEFILGCLFSFISMSITFDLFMWKVRSWLQINIFDKLEKIDAKVDANGKFAEEVGKKLNELAKISNYELKTNGGGSTKDIVIKTYNVCKEFQSREEINFYFDIQPKMEFDSNGFCTKANYKWRELTGLSENDAINNKWLYVINSFDRDKIQRGLENLLEKDVPFEEVFRINTNNKEIQLKMFAATVKENGQNKLVIATFEVLKVTELKSVSRV